MSHVLLLLGQTSCHLDYHVLFKKNDHWFTLVLNSDQGLFSWYFVSSHAHKNTVMEVKLNLNGNWLLTASRDHLCKLFDIRNLKEELQVFRGHKKEATGQWLWYASHSITVEFWHPNNFVFLYVLVYSCGLASCSWRTFCQWRVWWLFVILACWVCGTHYVKKL